MGLRTLGGLFFAGVVVNACGPGKSPAIPQPPSQVRSPSLPDRNHGGGVNDERELESAVERLVILKGTFSPTNGILVPGNFIGDHEPFLTLGRFGDQAVVRLVTCLDDMRPASTTVHGLAVSRGVMCYAALNGVAYIGDDEEAKDSVLISTPFPSAHSLAAAKRAWQNALVEKRYHLL